MAIIGDGRFIASKVAYRCAWPPEWNSGGQGFEPPRLHHPPNTDKQMVFLMFPPQNHGPLKKRLFTSWSLLPLSPTAVRVWAACLPARL